MSSASLTGSESVGQDGEWSRGLLAPHSLLAQIGTKALLEEASQRNPPLGGELLGVHEEVVGKIDGRAHDGLMLHQSITPGRSVLEHVREQSGLADQYLRSLLGMFGLRGDLAFQDAGTLSGGEKTKLALTMLVTGGHNVLILDEPTNHLDLASTQVLERALIAFPGAVILVSHDRFFVEKVAVRQLSFDGQGGVAETAGVQMPL